MAALWCPRDLQTAGAASQWRRNEHKPPATPSSAGSRCIRTEAAYDRRGSSAMDARASRYHEVYARWQRDPQGFWGEAAQAVDWMEPPKQVFDPDAGVYGRWFAGGVCNTCWNAVDRHVMQGRGEQPAIIYDSPLAGQKRTISYYRLQVETQVLAAILRNFGVGKGDRVVLYMPMVPEAVVAMLACARCIPWCSAVSRRTNSPPASTTPSRK